MCFVTHSDSTMRFPVSDSLLLILSSQLSQIGPGWDQTGHHSWSRLVSNVFALVFHRNRQNCLLRGKNKCCTLNFFFSLHTLKNSTNVDTSGRVDERLPLTSALRRVQAAPSGSPGWWASPRPRRWSLRPRWWTEPRLVASASSATRWSRTRAETPPTCGPWNWPARSTLRWGDLAPRCYLGIFF